MNIKFQKKLNFISLIFINMIIHTHITIFIIIYVWKYIVAYKRISKKLHNKYRWITVGEGLKSQPFFNLRSWKPANNAQETGMSFPTFQIFLNRLQSPSIVVRYHILIGNYITNYWRWQVKQPEDTDKLHLILMSKAIQKGKEQLKPDK